MPFAITVCSQPSSGDEKRSDWRWDSDSLTETSVDGPRAPLETSCNTQRPAVRDAAGRRRHRMSDEGIEPWPRDRVVAHQGVGRVLKG